MICLLCHKGRLSPSTSDVPFDVAGVMFSVTVSCDRCSSCDETLVSHHELQRAYLEMAAELNRQGCYTEESLRFIRKTLGHHDPK